MDIEISTFKVCRIQKVVFEKTMRFHDRDCIPIKTFYRFVNELGFLDPQIRLLFGGPNLGLNHPIKFNSKPAKPVYPVDVTQLLPF